MNEFAPSYLFKRCRSGALGGALTWVICALGLLLLTQPSCLERVEFDPEWPLGTTCFGDSDCQSHERCISHACRVVSPHEPVDEVRHELPRREVTEVRDAALPEHRDGGHIEPSPEQRKEADEPTPVCTNGAHRDCYEADPKTRDVGNCHGGVQSCINGQWTICREQSLPQEERCDKIDNDCDGQIDEGCPPQRQPCEPCQEHSQCRGQVGRQGACLQGGIDKKEKACFLPCNTQADCPQGFICATHPDGDSFLYCVPPRLNRDKDAIDKWLWWCPGFRRIGASCKKDEDCGDHFKDSRGARCEQAHCTLYCRQDEHCTQASQSCKGKVCE